MIKTTASTIDEYIGSFPTDIQKLLRQVRATVSKAAPGAEEAMSYGIPTYRLNGNLVHFAAYKNHIGFYPGPAGITGFEKELAEYKQGKGSIQFPIDRPLPLKLITQIVKFRVLQNKEKKSRK